MPHNRCLLIAMCSHVLSRGEQMVRYYGYYSNLKGFQRLLTLKPLYLNRFRFRESQKP